VTEKQWKELKYFSPKENWGKPEEMDFSLLKKLDSLRELIGVPIFINKAWADRRKREHAPRSLHYEGKAVDCCAPRLSLLKFFLLALRFEFGGIGIYPFWRRPGLHLDVREGQAFWWRNEAGYYLPFNSQLVQILSGQEESKLSVSGIKKDLEEVISILSDLKEKF